jgi:hypothetical protein
MKKTLVLALMVLVVASMSVMAGDLTVSGEALYEFYHDFDSVYGYNGDGEIQVLMVVDDFNTAKVMFEYTENGDDGTGGAGTAGASGNVINLDEANFTTALGKYLGLEEMGVTVTLIWGYQEWNNAEYSKVTIYEDEETWDANDENWGIDLDVGIMDMVHVEAAFMPEPEQHEMMFGVYGGVDPVHVEVYYDRNGAMELEGGLIGLGVNFAMDVMPGMFAFELGVGFAYYLDPDVEADDDIPPPAVCGPLEDITGIAGTTKYDLGVGLHMDIMDMLYAEVGFRGTDDSIFMVMWFAVGGGYEGIVGVDIGVGLTMDDDYWEDVMDEVDISVWTNVGAAKFRVGYLLHAVQWDIPGTPTNYFMALKAPNDGNYDPTAAENGVVYFAGELDY